MRLSEVPMDVVEPIFGLLKGPTGTGKSLAATTFPKPILFVDLDGKWRSIITYYRHQPEVLEQIEVKSATTYPEYCKIIQDVRALDSEEQYATIVIDSLTMLCELILREIIKDERGLTNQMLVSTPPKLSLIHI